MILGIDLGNVNVKTSAEVIYPNKLTQDKRIYEDTEMARLDIEGQKYVLGIGEYQTNYIKADKKYFIPALLGAIAQSTEDNINQIVLGLPIQQYKNDKDKLEQKVSENRINNIKFAEKSRHIIISDCKVFPEGLATYYSLDDEVKINIGRRDIIIIDMGGRTTNICLYSLIDGKRKLINYITIPAGTLNIYSDFINAINDKYCLDKLKEDAPAILSQGLWVDGEKVDLKFTKGIFEKYFERIINEVRLNYPIRTAQNILCGGGGILLQGLFNKDIKELIVINDIFCNAKGFKRIGESIWH
jgi:plasmid segregation protein ParM